VGVKNLRTVVSGGSTFVAEAAFLHATQVWSLDNFDVSQDSASLLGC
jgi:hypothetical protein